jgi:AcrR family transcriptional regulator
MAERGRPRSFDRTQALTRAMEVFWAKGYEGASMADLTTAMGINSPSIYAAFGCKEALFEEAVELYAATEGGRIWGSLETAATARVAIEGLLRASAVEFTRPGQPRGCLIVLGVIHADDASTALRDAMQKRRRKNIDELQQRLKRAVADGELPAETPCRAIATFYVTVQQGMSLQARDGASHKTLLAVADCAMAAWEGLVSAAR